MKAVVATFNQEKALIGAFSVMTNLRMELFEALCVAGYWLPRPPDEDVLVDEAELWLVEVGAGVEAGVGADHGQAGAARARVLRQAHLNQRG